MTTARISRIGDTSTDLGESPVWSSAEQAMYWIDWQRQVLYRQTLTSGAAESWEFDQRIGCLAPLRDYGVILGLERIFVSLDPRTGRSKAVSQLPNDDPANALNDGRCDRNGRFWCGTWDSNGRAEADRIYCLETSGECRPSGPPVMMANGIAWSPDQKTIYFAETHDRVILSADFDLDAGEIGSPQLFANVPLPGMPDGAVVDTSGCLWSAEYGGQRLVRYRPDGRVDRVIDLPMRYPTSCVFGGPDLDILFVTTALDPGSGPCPDNSLGGALLAIDGEAQGFSEIAYPGTSGPT